METWTAAVDALKVCAPFILYPYAGGEPALSDVSALIRFARENSAAFIAGIGGGSIIDLAKAAAGLFNAKEQPGYYQAGGPLETPGIPFLAVPTTAGSGAEATPNAVITGPSKKTKLSIRDPGFAARTVVLDGDLLSGLPGSTLRFSGMDAYIQAYEAYISKKAVVMTDTLALRSLFLVCRNLPVAAALRDRKAFSQLIFGSFLAGAALATARLGVIHGIAHPLGALYREPHGLVCAACLVPSIKFNREAMGGKYAGLSRAVGGDFLEQSEKLMESLKIVSPFKGKALIEPELIIEETLKSGSTAANPRTVARQDVEYLLTEIF
jgi:alcohol dehydrogenase class IV